MNSFSVILILVGCVGLGMFLGAWFATRGFEKAMGKMLEENLACHDGEDEADDIKDL